MSPATPPPFDPLPTARPLAIVRPLHEVIDLTNEDWKNQLSWEMPKPWEVLSLVHSMAQLPPGGKLPVLLWVDHAINMDIMEDEVQRNVARRQGERKVVTLEDMVTRPER